MSKKSLSAKGPYELLKARFEQLIDLGNAFAILAKDAEVFMPEKSAKDRGRQLEALTKVMLDLTKAPEVGEWLDKAEKGKAFLPPADQRNLELIRKRWVHETAVPDDLTMQVTRIYNEGDRLHTKLRNTGDWSKMEKWYTHVVDVMQAIGKAKKEKLKAASCYEALLDGFSPGLSDELVAREFGKLEKALPSLIREATKRQAKEPPPIALTGTFPRAKQEDLCRRVATAMGFDFKKGRMDMINAHPSCGGSASDVRYSVDCDEKNFLQALYSLIHETGHALYEQNTPAKWRYQPVGSTMGMSIHESQSRIMEVQACHTPEFFQYLEKTVREVFDRPDDPALSAKNLEKLVNTAKPSFIRVQADELTYSAHIILRWKLERDMVEGNLAVKDMPKAWNEGMKTLLGITPPDASKGHMQDVHWPCGYVGYFPAYTFGDMGAAQFFHAACKAKPEIRKELAKGNFKPLREWLRDNVYGKGSLLTTDELFIQATGEKLNADYYLDHLSRRYLGKPLGADASMEHKKVLKKAHPAARRGK